MIDVCRRELKYLVSLRDIASLKKRLSVVMEKDSHNGADGYLVRSLYFDSLYDTDFEEKVDGYDNRKKIRLRVYDFDSQTAKLELKEKEGSSQRKRSLLLNREEAEHLIKGEYEFLLSREEEIAHWLYTYMTMKCYRPKCIVEYDRFAYCEVVNDIRVTFDANLRATESCGKSQQ
ncbi:MAG: polyphosphate polymerase domain-containing protein [Lachnospiraceae bacterium]|nr:polyphosphate polymerase domain-containing protein [Lachnospiraceae bacterium]